MTLRFNSYELEPLALSKGRDQGCPLSRIAYQFYNTYLEEICDTNNGEDTVAFMDDTLLLAWGKSLNESNAKVKQMMVRQGGGLDWVVTHQSNFTIDTFGIIGLTRRREQNPLGAPRTRHMQWHQIFLQGVKVPVVANHKFLGIIMDQELHWKEHMNYALHRGTKWVTQYRRLAKPSWGVSAKFMRQFYTMVAVPKVLYATDLFLFTESHVSKVTKGFMTR